MTALLIGLAVSWAANGTLVAARMPEYAVATAMVLLGLQKLQDVESFSTMFLNYDLLAQRYVPYSYVYPYAETLAGILMLAGALIYWRRRWRCLLVRWAPSRFLKPFMSISAS
ncbi:hypothetical protein HSBAA_18890 [Vreelandella sulfidaeris]|uniref:Uncharacterized protein n=1 Tax=Vreelandella sulfidaeris TaxID=115553 RepID=A0A455U5U8_9GAMM|nr:hypothetical protein HSBAA_18890 [Halomonas sulfidaeris]